MPDKDRVKPTRKPKPESKKISFGGVSNTRIIIMIVILFVVYLIFYPESSFRESSNIRKEIATHRAEIEKLQQEIKQDCVIINGIKTNKIFLIKYSRESLNLSAENEDLYVQ